MPNDHVNEQKGVHFCAIHSVVRLVFRCTELNHHDFVAFPPCAIAIGIDFYPFNPFRKSYSVFASSPLLLAKL